MNIRQLALEAVINIMEKGAYANISVNFYLHKIRLEKADRRLFSRLVYGTVENLLKIKFLLAPFIKKSTKTKLKYLLYLSVYQLEFTELPPYAVVNEAVKIASGEGKYAASFINGVLRNYFRSAKPDPSRLEKNEYLSIEYSHPLWLVELLLCYYDYEVVESILKENNSVRPLSVRVNTIKTTVADAKALLRKQGIAYEDSPFGGSGLIINDDLYDNSLVGEGKLVFQDASAQLVVPMMNPVENSRLVDLCAGPGGKAAHLAAHMNNTGKIYALDIHPHKIKLMESYFSFLGIKNIETLKGDARNINETLENSAFNGVLADVPCSGLGVISHKKDLRYKINIHNIRELICLQKDILKTAWLLVKRGGICAYSTCTINPQENEEVIREFVKTYPDAYIKKERLVLPHEYHTDGFYICVMEKQ